ncbi:hypothetical protein, partial [Rhizobium sp. BK226]|uniref:hypothetical protein n=1 Tax=Rhizobium sp. BK226 TaxID=2587075 RepID=UPI001AEEF0A5
AIFAETPTRHRSSLQNETVRSRGYCGPDRMVTFWRQFFTIRRKHLNVRLAARGGDLNRNKN